MTGGSPSMRGPHAVDINEFPSGPNGSHNLRLTCSPLQLNKKYFTSYKQLSKIQKQQEPNEWRDLELFQGVLPVQPF